MAAVHNFTALVRLILRRDRLFLPCWILGLVVLGCFFAPMMPDFMGDEASQEVMREMLKNPAMIAMMGISYGEGFGAVYAQFLLVWVIIGGAIFNIMFVMRHTRKDEEEGRLEMLAALPVGRSANLLAVLLVALVADALTGALTAVAIAAFAVEGIDAAGAWCFGASVAAGNLTFAGLAALFAQLCSTSKAANALSYISLGLAYMLRAMGDTDASYEACSLISPLGLALRCQAWVENLYWPAVVLAAMALVLGGVAFLLCRMRDSGAGLLPQRKGRLHASPLLRGEWGLAWRLTRGTCLGWVVAGFICGAMYGSIFKDMSGFFESNELYSQLLGAGTTDPAELVKSFSAFLMQIMCVLLAIPVCMVAMKFAAEEKRGRMEQLYGKAVPRLKVIAGYLLIALLLGLVLLLVTALGMWLAAAAMMEHPPDLSMMVLSGLRYYPAMVLFAGLAALIAGLAPRFTPLLWVYLVYAFFISYMGNMLKLPALAEQISPLDWLKPVTTTVGSLFANFFKAFGLETSYSLPEYQPLSITVICIIGIVLAAFGCLAYRRRDIRG